MHYAEQLFRVAQDVARCSGISLQEAIGQVIGGTIWYVDEVLYERKLDSLSTLKGSEFHKGLESMISQWFK